MKLESTIGLSNSYTNQWFKDWGRSIDIKRWISGTDFRTLKVFMKQPSRNKTKKVLKFKRNDLRLMTMGQVARYVKKNILVIFLIERRKTGS